MHGIGDRSKHEGTLPREIDASGSLDGARRQRPAQIRYLYERHPEGAETFEVAPGILWARVPLPFRLDHVNVWLVRDTDGWTLIDTGTASPGARAVWETLLGGVLSGAPIVRLIGTHGHTDHVGLAGWLHGIADEAPYHISLIEWQSARLRLDEAKAPVPKSAMRFLGAHGCDSDSIQGFADDRRHAHAYLEPLPDQIQRISEGTRLVFGGREWQAMVCGGHASAHVSLWCEADRILIAGDQILSKITPMIGVNPHEPDADSLTEYLTSLDRFRALAADALVLPSHGLPFHGLRTRADELAHHHELRLNELEVMMAGPENAMRLAHGLFPKAVAGGHARHAFAETLAHAHHLVTLGRAVRLERDGGYLFQATSRT